VEKTHDVTIDYASHNNYFDDFIYVFRQCTLNSPSICKNAYRHNAAKRQTAGIKFTQWPKNSIFALQGRLAIHVKFSTGNRYVGPIGLGKYLANRCTRPSKFENFHFLINSHPLSGEPFDRPKQFIGVLSCAQLPCISVSHLTWFGSQVTELLLTNRASVIYAEVFHAPCRENYALDR